MCGLQSAPLADRESAEYFGSADGLQIFLRRNVADADLRGS